MCLLQLPFWLKVALQYGQANGFSPVWTRICISISNGVFLVMEQNGQANFCPPSLMGPVFGGSFCNKWNEIFKSVDIGNYKF